MRGLALAAAALLISGIAAAAPPAPVPSAPVPSAPVSTAPVPSAAVPTPERSQELLFEAARLGRTDLIAPLLKAGAKADGRDPRGFTALILAAYNDHLDTVEALLAAKADPCLPDRDQGNTAQMGVAFKGYDAIAARLLKTPCPVDARNKAGQTALMMAALFGRTRQVELLVAAGADRSAADASGRTAASVARDQGNTSVADRLAPPR